MCVIGLKDTNCFQWIIDEFEGLLIDLEVVQKDFAHGFYCGMRTHLGFYDAEAAKLLLSASQHDLHLELWRTYVNTVDLFPSMGKDEVIESTKRIIEILSSLESTVTESDEDDHDHDCYFTEYVQQRDRANTAEKTIDAYKQEIFIMRQREASLEKQLIQIKRQRVTEIRYQQTRQRKNRR